MMFRRTMCGLLLSVCAASLSAQPAPMEQPGKWAQDYTGRKADPAVRFGTLPNGLRYAIMHNETPSDGVAMRMRIGSGSLQERDGEQGLAHFIEHMAFRGSANVADGDAVRMLQRQGLAFGADTNASTTFDQTIYMFNFPKADAAAIDTGLTLFREIGGRLNLSQAAMDAERGVILSEERLRDTPQYRTQKAEFATLLAGTRAPDRWTIGKTEVIQTAMRDRLQRFYQANYRPDNATIVIVGKIDPAAVEQQIRQRFSDWKAQAAPDAIDLGAPTGAHKVGEIIAPGVPDQVTLSWIAPSDTRAETEAVDRQLLLQRVALTVLNLRLSDMSLKPGAPFVGASASAIRSIVHSGSGTLIELSAPPEKWQAALDAVSAEQRRLVRDGIQPNELKRAVAILSTLYQNAAATASTRKSTDIANAIVNTVNSEELYSSAAQDLAFVTPILANVTTAEADAALKTSFSARGPLLFRSAQKTPAGDAQLASALGDAYARPLGASVKEAAIAWPYGNVGKPGAVASRVSDAKLGTTTVRFANGTRLIVKPTAFEKDKISVGVLFGNGRAGADPALAHGLWQTSLFTIGGTGKLPTAQVQQWAQENSKLVSVALSTGTRSYVLVGATRPKDLASEMQVLEAYARDPGFRPEAGDKIRSLAPMMAGQLAGNPGAVYTRGAQALMVGNDPRFLALPSDADLARVDPSVLPRLLKGPLAGQADVVMAGDVTVDQAIAAIQATFAAGPGGAKAPVVPARVTMPRARSAPFVFEHSGRPDQAFYGEYFPLPDYFADPKVDAVADVAAAVISSRLVDTVREQLGLTYSPQVEATSAAELQGEGYLAVTLETPPANFDKFHGLMASQLRDLAAKPVGADELARAKQPLVEAERKKRETNAFWLGKLAQIARDPRIEGETLEAPARLAAVTPADVQSFIARFAANRQPIVVIARAKGSGTTAAR
jgi:zinc protease